MELQPAKLSMNLMYISMKFHELFRKFNEASLNLLNSSWNFIEIYNNFIKMYIKFMDNLAGCNSINVSWKNHEQVLESTFVFCGV